MAEILTGVTLPPHRHHPWSEWLDGQARVATVGSDFANSKSFAVMLYRKAKSLGRPVTVIRSPDGTRVEFQFPVEKETDSCDATKSTALDHATCAADKESTSG